MHENLSDNRSIDEKQEINRFENDKRENDDDQDDQDDELEFSKIPLEQILSACSSRIFENKF